MIGIFEYFNLGGCFIYSLILLAIISGMSKDKTFRTPFWIFFISGGLYGIYCVLVFDFDWSWDAPSAIIRRATSTISALAHTIAKLYVGIIQYAVLSSKYLTEHNMKRRYIAVMLAVQFLVPTLVCVPFAFAVPTGEDKEYGPNYLTDIVRVISAFLYGAYVIVGLVLTILSMRRLRQLMRLARKSVQKQTISAVQRETAITVYSSLLFLSHSLKCVQQIIFVVFADHPQYADILLSYPYINDIAVFSSPALLLITSSKLRRLICSYFTRRSVTIQPSTAATVTTLM